MGSSSRLMIESCRCGAEVPEVCVCTIAPFAEPTVPPRVQASTTAGTVAVHPVLMRALARAGYSKCEDPANRLSTRQMSALMDQAGSIQARIELKQLIGMANIWPTGAV